MFTVAAEITSITITVGDNAEIILGRIKRFAQITNDLPLLAWAGRSVAMENAHLAVKEIADEVTLSNDEDGVAVYLDRLLSR